MTEAEAKAAITKMLRAFNTAESALCERLELYWEVLHDLPPKEVAAACWKAARGRLGGDGRFPPTAAQLCVEILGEARMKTKRRYGDDGFVSSSGTLYLRDQRGNQRIYRHGEWEQSGHEDNEYEPRKLSHDD